MSEMVRKLVRGLKRATLGGLAGTVMSAATTNVVGPPADLQRARKIPILGSMPRWCAAGLWRATASQDGLPDGGGEGV